MKAKVDIETTAAIAAGIGDGIDYVVDYRDVRLVDSHPHRRTRPCAWLEVRDGVLIVNSWEEQDSRFELLDPASLEAAIVEIKRRLRVHERVSKNQRTRSSRSPRTGAARKTRGAESSSGGTGQRVR